MNTRKLASKRHSGATGVNLDPSVGYPLDLQLGWKVHACDYLLHGFYTWYATSQSAHLAGAWHRVVYLGRWSPCCKSSRSVAVYRSQATRIDAKYRDPPVKVGERPFHLSSPVLETFWPPSSAADALHSSARYVCFVYSRKCSTSCVTRLVSIELTNVLVRM